MNNFKKLIIGIVFLAISFINTVSAQISTEIHLFANKAIDKTISNEESHPYYVNLENGSAIIGKVASNGIDLLIDVFDPTGKRIKQIESSNGSEENELIDITAAQSGKYSFVVHSMQNATKEGTYTLKIDRILSLSENADRITKRELPTATLYNLWKASLSDSSAIDNFIKNHSEKHIVESIEGSNTGMLVTYFCIPPDNTEYVMLSGGPDFLGLRFQQLPGTKLHFVTQRVPKDARFNYGFNFFNIDKAGPNNQIETRSVQHAYDGTLEMPNAPEQSYITEREQVEKGSMVINLFESKILHEERKISIHTPVGYDASREHNLLIVFDGESYGARPNRGSRIPTPTIMDNLLSENKISPTVTVMVWAMGKRSSDLISETFGDFIAKELIPWVRSNYNIALEPNKVILAGSSRGGFAASFIAFNHSDVIGNVLSQSGSYWIKGTEDENHWIYPEDNGKLINLYKQSDQLPIKFYMDIGLYDAGASMLGMNRQFRDILELKGYEVDYREFKGGHNYVNWRGTFSDGLISLIGID